MNNKIAIFELPTVNKIIAKEFTKHQKVCNNFIIKPIKIRGKLREKCCMCGRVFNFNSFYKI